MMLEIEAMPKAVVIRGEMTIYQAAELKEQLFAAIRAVSGDITLDTSGVTAIDTVGLQALLMTQRVAVACGTRLSLVDPSEAVREVLSLCRLESLIAPETLP
jgi:anti-sigma B factor antagonist